MLLALLMAVYMHPVRANFINSDVMKSGKVLHNFVMETFPAVTGIMECWEKCEDRLLCKSINVHTDGMVCELNNSTHLPHYGDLGDSPNSVYLIRGEEPNSVCSSVFCGGDNSSMQCLVNDDGLTHRCENCSGKALGLEDYRIADSQMTSSTNYGQVRHEAWYARINHPTGSWITGTNNNKQWLKIDLVNTTMISMIAIQGRQYDQHWVTKFYISYSLDDVTWVDYKDNNNNRIDFPGSTDRFTIVYHVLPYGPIKTRFIKYNVLEWHSYIAMRAELYGCVLP